jgi:hypothetical protein
MIPNVSIQSAFKPMPDACQKYVRMIAVYVRIMPDYYYYYYYYFLQILVQLVVH